MKKLSFGVSMFLVLIFFSKMGLSQTGNISAIKLETLLKGTYDSFETFVLNSDFVFIKREEKTYVSYTYKNSKNEFLIFSILKNTSLDTSLSFNNQITVKMIQFQTNNTSNYLSLKEQCQKIGYKFIASVDAPKKINENVTFNNYRSKNFEFSFFIADPAEVSTNKYVISIKQTK